MSREKNPWFHFGLAIGANIQDNQLALPREWNDNLPSPSARHPTPPRKISITPAHSGRGYEKRLQAVP